MSETIINTIPCLTWNWMKINKDKVELTVPFTKADFSNKQEIKDYLSSTEPDLSSFAEIGSGCANFANPKLNAEDHAPNPVNIKDVEPVVIYKLEEHPLNQLIDSVIEKPEVITINGKLENPIVLSFENCGKENQIAAQTIVAKKDSQATIIFLYKADENETETNTTQIIRTRVYVEENAKINIVKVQLLGKNTNQIDDTAFVCNDNASAVFTQIELGANHVDSGLHTTLSGYQSKFKSDVAYLCQNEQYLDMNHIVYHFGQKSECNMKVSGTLKDTSTKTYRGIIDLKKGCSGAKGHEMEETLLLNPKVINKSLPVILCDEEDVEGVHGSTIGRLSGDILFYMQTRGISLAEAEKIMAKAKIQAVADLIPDDQIKQQIEDYLEKNFKQD